MPNESNSELDLQMACLEAKSALLQLQAALLALKGELQEALDAEVEEKHRLFDHDLAASFAHDITPGDHDFLSRLRISL